MSDQSAVHDAVWMEKLALEAAIIQGEGDPGKLNAYMRALEAVNRSCTGIVSFRWPSVTYPLYFRCGSSDIWSFKQVFVSRDYAFPVPYEPRRILDLGAYAGYVSVYFAERFPAAHIIALEPMPDNFRMLSLNTAAYRNINILNAAVWGSSQQLSIQPNNAEDWGGSVGVAEEQGRGIKALSIPDILKIFGWFGADFIKCDIEGAEVSVFSGARECISKMVTCCAVETHDIAVPGSSDIVAKCFDPVDFAHTRRGELDLFVRREMDLADMPAPVLAVLQPGKGLREITLKNVPEASWGFYLFGGDSCQLHPGQGVGKRPEVSTVLQFEGQSTFECEIAVQNPLGFGVKFILEIRSPEDDRVVFQAESNATAGERRRWTQQIPVVRGPHRVALQTMMAEGVTTSHKATANWLGPSLR